MVIAIVGQPLGRPRLDVLSRLTSPRGWLLHVWPVVVLDREGSCILVHESPRRVDIIVVMSLLLGVAIALGEVLA